MGTNRRNYAQFALILSVAIFGVVAVFAIFTSSANSQFLRSSANYANNISQILNIRFGEHPDKTRIVLDIKHPTNLSYKISKDGKTIELILPKATWGSSAAPPQIIDNNIVDFAYTSTQEGSRLIIKNRAPVKLLKPFFLSPNGNFGHRIVIDFTPSTSPIINNINIKNIKKTNVSLVASLNNIGALPKQNNEVVQLSRQQNPYIQRAFPQTNGVPRKPKPALVPRRTQMTHQPIRPRRTPTIHAPYQPMVTEEQKKLLNLKDIYARGTVGMQLLNETSNDGNGYYDQEWDPGFILSGAFGTKLENGLRAEGEMFYSNASLKQMSGTWNSTEYNTEIVHGDISSMTFMGNIIYDFKTNSKLTPYAMAGVGMTLLSLNDLQVLTAQVADDTDLVAAIQIGTGFSFDLDRRTSIELGYRYFDTQRSEFADTYGIPFESIFSSHSFLLGARVDLN